MIVKQFRLSQQEKERLIRIKARTGISHWNVLCRWAFCYSLADPSLPSRLDIGSDSNVEMTWQTFGGEHHETFEALLRQRCVEDGLPTDRETLALYFRLHLNRGINYLSSKNGIRHLDDLLSLVTQEE